MKRSPWLTTALLLAATSLSAQTGIPALPAAAAAAATAPTPDSGSAAQPAPGGLAQQLDAGQQAILEQRKLIQFGAAATQAQDAFISALLAQTKSSVATIIVSQSTTKFSLLAKALGRSYKYVAGTATGTGWVVAPGFLVTNNHVVDSHKIGETVSVQFEDHQTVEGIVVAKNKKKDLAFVKVKEDPAHPPLPLGDSEDVAVGDSVVALGATLGLRDNATIGRLTRRGFTDFDGPGPYLQVDAVINHGNSGGPLLNMQGQVIGVNYAGPEPYSGIGWAIPVEYVKQAAFELMTKHKLLNAAIGIELAKPEWIPSQELPLPMRPKHDSGLWIAGVIAGSPAEKAGLRAGDQILAVDGAALPLPSYDAIVALRRALSLKEPGQAVALEISRDGACSVVELPLMEVPSHE